MALRKSAWIAIWALGLLGSTSATALESGFYIGVIGAQTSVDVDDADFTGGGPVPANFTETLDDSDNAFGLVVGGQFGRWVAVETQIIDLGEYKYSFSETIPNFFSTNPRNLDIRGSSSTEAAAITLSGILTIPIGDTVAIGVRAGLAVSAAETRFEYEEKRGNNTLYYESDDNDAEASDIDATFGLSVEWTPFQHFGLRLEYQRINNVGAEDDDYDYGDDDFDDEEEHPGNDVDLISLNLIGRF